MSKKWCFENGVHVILFMFIFRVYPNRVKLEKSKIDGSYLNK